MPAPRRVLVVDDDGDIREVLRMVLASRRIEAVGAEHGGAALDLLHGDPRFGLVLLDIMMPVIDGWGFLEARRADPGLLAIPVVVLSADPRATRRAPDFGIRDALAKPVLPRDLLRVVARYLDDGAS